MSWVALAKLIDFGIARNLLDGDATIMGRDFAGKYAYVAPEQLGPARNEAGSETRMEITLPVVDSP